MPGWISSLLSLLGFGAKIAAKNQDIINSPEVRRAKIAKENAAELDTIHTTTQKGDIETTRDDFSH